MGGFTPWAYQPPANSTFLSEQTSHQQPATNTFLSKQTSHHPRKVNSARGRLERPRRLSCAHHLLASPFFSFSSFFSTFFLIHKLCAQLVLME
jgi:hypothetical protein